MHGFFYNSALKNYFNVIAKLFSDIYILRNTGEDTYLNRVPINMVDETKVAKARNKINSHDSKYDVAKVSTIFPHMNLKLVDIVPNALNAIGSTVSINRYGERQYSPAPINMLFEVNIQTKSMNDSSMIIEQIIPYLRPHFTVTMKEICNGRVIHERDIRLVYQTTSINNDTLGDTSTDTIYDWSVIFEMIGFIYPPQINMATEENIIKTVFLNFKGDMVSIGDNPDELTEEFESVDLQVDDMSIEDKDEWIEKGSKYKESRTENIPVPEKEPSEIRKNDKDK